MIEASQDSGLLAQVLNCTGRGFTSMDISSLAIKNFVNTRVASLAQVTSAGVMTIREFRVSDR